MASADPRPEHGALLVSVALDGAPLDRALRVLSTGEDGAAPSWNRVRRWIETGKVRLGGVVVTDVALKVRKGQALELVMHARAPREEPLPDLAIVYFDREVVVVEKPPGMNSVPFDENERGALSQLVEQKLAKASGQRRAPLGIVHRLDRDTTGLMVFARTLKAKRELKNQFRFHTVKRRYWAIVEGAAQSRTITSRLVQDRGDGRRGSISNPTLGRSATTHVRVLKALSGATLLECQLETGRTHQIRIHLGEAGHPLLGERVYGRKQAGPEYPVPRVMLHAFELGFMHPLTEQPLHFTSEMPEDMRIAVSRLGSSEAPANEPRPHRRAGRGFW